MAFMSISLYIRSIMPDAKKTQQSDFAENPKFKKMEAPFENRPQVKSGLVSIQLVLKGKVK